MEGCNGKGSSLTPPPTGSPTPQPPAAPEEALKGRETRQKSRSASSPAAARAARQEGVRIAMTDDFNVREAVQDLQELHKYVAHCACLSPFTCPVFVDICKTFRSEADSVRQIL